jgi:diguanylate cyclase (GGDEF)-like protein
VSDGSDGSDVPDVPDVSDVSDVSGGSGGSDVPDRLNLSDVSDRSEVSELSNTPGEEETTAAVIDGVLIKERTPDVWRAPATGAISDLTSTEAKPIFSLPQTADGDFLERAAVIDAGLQALLALERGSDLGDAKSAQETTIWQEIATQIHATHHWWTDFEGTLTEKLSRGAGRPIHPEQRAQVEDDLVAMQASLVECQSLLDEARSAAETAVTPRRDGGKAAQSTAPARVRGGLMGAIKACHHLRDNLVMLLPEPPLRFHSDPRHPESRDGVPTAPVPSFVAQHGLAGATATVQNWQSQLTADTPNVASLLLVDFDRTNHWNQRLGLRAMDWILDSCHCQIAESIRHNRGFDRVVRVGGQQFLVFLGSTPVASAKFAADRLRQVFEHATWEVADQSVAVHCSLTVGSFRPNQPLAAQINGLRLGMAEAKRLGGNVVVEPSPTGRFQQIAGVPTYSLPPRQHRQPCEKWNPKAAVSC